MRVAETKKHPPRYGAGRRRKFAKFHSPAIRDLKNRGAVRGRDAEGGGVAILAPRGTAGRLHRTNTTKTDCCRAPLKLFVHTMAVFVSIFYIYFSPIVPTVASPCRFRKRKRKKMPRVYFAAVHHPSTNLSLRDGFTPPSLGKSHRPRLRFARCATSSLRRDLQILDQNHNFQVPDLGLRLPQHKALPMRSNYTCQSGARQP